MAWTKQSIVAALQRLEGKRADLSYTGLAKRNQRLLSAAAYHFGSYRTALQRAGLNADHVSRRPRWSKQLVIAAVKLAKRKELELNWSAVTGRGDELARAAFAAVRLFGSWDRALHAAGLHAEDVARYRAWDRATIAYELKTLHQNGDDVRSGTIQTEDPGLHAAALRHFGSYKAALRAALGRGKR